VERRRFGTTRAELERLRDWLRDEEITHAVMESTGSYWKPVFNVLEDSVQVLLANAQQVKTRKGHKTDDKDGWWLAHLLRHAMIYPSFIPPRPIRELRDLTRRRKRLLSNATAEKNRIQKILEDANVKLGNVLSDVFGVSGQLMLDALLAGQSAPDEIAHLAKGSAKKKVADLVAALEGHQMSDHHRRMIRFSLEHLRFLEQQLEQMDSEIEQQIRAAGLEEKWKLLQSVPGLKDRSAAAILAETGGEVKPFASARHFSSWAGVCPGNNRSAGRDLGRRPTGGNPWLRSALTECAWAAAATKDCFLKDKFWRLAGKAQGGKKTALIAVAHTLLLLIHHVLQTGEPFQQRHSPGLAERQKQKMIQHHIRRLGKLGISIPRSIAVSEKPKHGRCRPPLSH
jgi:transposase